GELVALINNPILAELYFIKTGKSSFTKYLLFEGPTGSGKTYMAEALAGSINNSHFWYIESKTIKKDQYVNSTQKNLEAVFDKIRAFCDQGKFLVVLMDEVDTFLTKRSSNIDQAVLREANDIVNRFLTFLDGVNGHPPNLIFIGTTNKFQLLDDAVVRPGRFQKVNISYPDQKGVEVLVQHYLREAFARSGIPYSTCMEAVLIKAFKNHSPVKIQKKIEHSYEQMITSFILEYDRVGSVVSFDQFLIDRETDFVEKWSLIASTIEL
ncbi:MAG: ATP-binding protein, partial [Patescibacteria group bacterium]